MRQVRAVVLLLASLSASACASGFKLGPVLKSNHPTGDLGDVQDNGITVGATGEARLVALALVGELDYTRFSGGTVNGADTDGVGFWEVAGGGRFYLGTFFVGAQTGYLSGSSFSGDPILRPEVGVSIWKLTGLAQYKLGGDAHWWSLGASYSFF